MPIKKLAVTGSSGFIGTHLVRHLADQGYDVVGLDLNPPVDEYGLVNFVRGDIRNMDDVRRALQDEVQAVINLAAKHYDWGITPEEYFDYNVNGSRTLLAGMREAGVQNYVFYSTIAVYGEELEDRCCEETPPAPNLPYGASKLEAEDLTREWAAEDGDRSAVIIRPCVVFGPRNFTNTFNLMKQIDSGFFLPCGRGETVKAMCYVGNLVRATEMCLRDMQPGVEVFNYTDEPDVEVREVIRMISEALGKRSPSVHMPMWMGLAAGRVFDAAAKISGKNFGVSTARVRKLEVPILIDSGKIRTQGFNQVFSIEEGLQDMASWFVDNFRGNPNPPQNPPY